MTTKTPYRAPISCEDVRALFSEPSGTHEAPGVERLGALRGHLSLCAQCRATYGARLEELVQHELSPKIVHGLGATMSIEVQQELLARLNDTDLCIRMAAVEALGSLGVAMPDAVQQALLDRLEDPEWTVRMGAVQALSRLDAAMPEAVRRALEARVMDRDPDVKQAAEAALSLVSASAASVGKSGVQPSRDGFQRLVATTRDLLWSMCAPRLTPAFATMGGSHRVVLEEEEAKGTEIPSAIVLTEAESVHAGPLLTGSGRFHLTVHGPESRLVGKDLCCDLQLIEGRRLSLRTPIRAASEASGWEAIFDEPILTDPSLHSEADYRVPFDRDYLRLVVRPSRA